MSKRKRKTKKFKKRKKVKLKSHFEHIENKIEIVDDEISEDKQMGKNLGNGFEHARTTLLDGMNKLVEDWEKVVVHKGIIGYHKAFFEVYTNNVKNSVLPKINREKRDLKKIVNSKNRELKKLERKLDRVKDKFKYKECVICRSHYKDFKRNCLCKTDQYMCLVCIKKWFMEKINEEHSKGNTLCFNHIPCPFCKGEMKDFLCPFCPKGKSEKDCIWCNQNKEIKNMTSNFISEILL